jgi:hypothetical protein
MGGVQAEAADARAVHEALDLAGAIEGGCLLTASAVVWVDFRVRPLWLGKGRHLVGPEQRQ